MSQFQKVYEEYAQPVYRFLLTLSGSQSQAEELLQETFLLAYEHIHRFRGQCNLYTWLCQIGKNAWLKECRRINRFADTPWEELMLPSDAPTPEQQAIQREEYNKARNAMLALEEPYRDVFILHALGAVKLKEIAHIYQKSESWARVTYFRARERILKEVIK